jgi:phosphoribosylformylglycinamidine synthase II
MVSAQDQAYLEKTLQRKLTPLELACFENLWSEHCSYRSTSALLKTFTTTGENVLLGPGDDAAIVRFSDHIALAIGMESHNHPSYVDPYDGAATGVGGIVRDVISMGARPIALMDPLYFGPLSEEKNRYLFEHVVGGIGDYGNCIGVPVVRGELVFDESYSGNPLVNVVCVGVVHPDSYLTARVKKPGSRLILFGASTGRDGLGGASFASRDLCENAEAADRPCVQVGDPFTEKLLIEATLEMAETGKVLSCRDLGAAGLAGASSEMSSTFGARIVADHVHLRETGMNEVEIFLAESQERILVEVAPRDVPLIGRIADKYDLLWSDIGEVIPEKRYIITFHGEVVCDLPVDLLVGGAPVEEWPEEAYSAEKPFSKPSGDLKSMALAVLSHPDIARKDWVSRQYDHDVQVRTLSLEHDAAILRLGGEALALSCGCNPRHIYLKPYEGAANSVLENASNLACRGAEPVCIVNCLNFASPVHPTIYWQLKQSVLGMGDMARNLKVPVVGGNVSLYNESDEFQTQIKPTPSIGMVGKGEMRRTQPPADGALLALIGSTRLEFGGSLLDVVTGCGGEAPGLGDHAMPATIRDLVCRNVVEAITDLSHGGLLPALAKLSPDASVSLDGEALPELFSESYGRFLIACRDEAVLKGLNHRIIGEVGGEGLNIQCAHDELKISRKELEEALSSTTRFMQY